MKATIQRHAVVTYFLLAFAISWSGVLMSLGGSAGMSAATPTGDPRFVIALLAMVGRPAGAGLALTALVHGRQGLLAFVSRLAAWRVSARWYAVALFAAPLLWTATTLALSVASPRFLPGILTSADTEARVLVGLTSETPSFAA